MVKNDLFECFVCKKCFNSNVKLKEHMEKVHEGKNNLKVEVI